MTLEEFQAVIAPYREVVLDIGTGDGRFVSAQAKANPDKFFIGIDANAKPLEKLSTKITRKPAKGGLPNAMFVQAAVEALPEEFTGIASEIHINFPWGSLLRAAALGDPDILTSLRRVAAPRFKLRIVIGVDQDRDRSELDRLGLPDLGCDHLTTKLADIYLNAGFRLIVCRELSASEWGRIETSWARKLGGNDARKVFNLVFEAAH